MGPWLGLGGRSVGNSVQCVGGLSDVMGDFSPGEPNSPFFPFLLPIYLCSFPFYGDELRDFEPLFSVSFFFF